MASDKNQGPYVGAAMLIKTLYGALTEKEVSSWNSRIVNSAVLAWYEGHVEGETKRRGPPKVTVQEPEDAMPAPPYPDRGSRRLQEIIQSCVEQYKEMPHLGAARAVVDAWEAGYHEGVACKGCHFRGEGDPRIAHLMRNGGLTVEFIASPALMALEPRLHPQEYATAEMATRQSLINLFAASLHKWEAREGAVEMPGAAATFDMLKVALEVFGQLTCWMMATDTKTTDKEAVKIIEANVKDTMTVAISKRIRELRQLGREVSFGPTS